MIYDIAIIGAGPAGLMAGITASELGAKVILIEKNERPGLKLLSTGGSRCNITNAIFDPKELAEKYGVNGKFLISGFNNFGVKETLDFFSNLGLATKIEKDNQVFPESNRSTEVLKLLLDSFKRNGGELLTNNSVRNIVIENNLIKSIFLNSNREIKASNYIIATGGRSYPATGSTGDAYLWLKKAGHNIVTPQPALSPLIIKENSIKKLEGLSLDDINLTLLNDGKKIKSLKGDIVFTSKGVSGPAALNLSRYVTGTTEKLTLVIDFLPNYSVEELDNHLRDLLNNHGTKIFKNILTGLVPPKLQYLISEIVGIPTDKKVSIISREERQKLVSFLKDLRLKVQSIGGFDKAIITKGGVSLNEINPKNMQSKIISNLFLAGELVDLDGPSGGYNLQICWTTGYLAGQGAVKKTAL